MKISRNWLNDFVDIKISDQILEEKLSLSGTLVEDVLNTIDSKIIVAKIKTVSPHPSADRLQIATIFDGSKDLQIVCGANNIEPGQTVPLATIGAQINGLKIKKVDIRGIESFGMLCSEKELGLSEDHAGIKILPENYEIGKPLNSYINNDTVFDLEITPNRGDCLSHLGIAREISTITGAKLVLEEKEDRRDSNSDQKITVDLKDSALCPQYMAQVIGGVKVGESPKWLKDRLLTLGQKPINNIVDITNYILFDLGQPLHAFDFDKIEDKIVVRLAQRDEQIESLDGSKRILSDKDLVIADSKKSIAIAGLIGGANSQVEESTKDIIIEAAEFDPVSVRKTSKRLNLSTEASYRFERGIDSGGLARSLDKAVKMILEIAGGKIGPRTAIGELPTQKPVEFNYEKINQILGLNIEKKQVDSILSSLGLSVSSNQAAVPYWRKDISCWQDLAEEVGRIYGYDKIKPLTIPKTLIPKKSKYYQKEAIKDILVDCGFSEVSNYVFLSEKDLTIAKIESRDLLEVSNPLQLENKYLRNSLIPHLLKNIAKNPSFDPIALFEIGSVFTKEKEKTFLGLAVSGKGAQNMLDEVRKKLGDLISIDQISRQDLESFKIRKPVVYVGEVDVDSIIKENSQLEGRELGSSEIIFNYKPISKYPPVVRDLAFIVDRSLKSGDISQKILDCFDKVIIVDLFDEFYQEKIGLDKKNLAYHIYLQDLSRAMTDEEVDLIIKEIVKKVEQEFNGKIRN